MGRSICVFCTAAFNERFHSMTSPTPLDDAHIAAKAAHLRYVSDDRPGFTRKPDGKGGWRYYDTEGKRITDKAILARIRSLGIPPAYRDVWICPLENGHLQATGRDARGRKQYRYHPHWRERRNITGCWPSVPCCPPSAAGWRPIWQGRGCRARR
jgi:DNA topoisomerase IB